MQHTSRTTADTIGRRDRRSFAVDYVSSTDLAERVLMFVVASTLWALVVLAAVQASQ